MSSKGRVRRREVYWGRRKTAAVYHLDAVIISIFQVRKLRLREVKWLDQGHTDSE